MGSDLIYAVDFDGVLCDSVEETSTSGVRAAATLWPSVGLGEPSQSPPSWLLNSMRVVRSVVETGFENVLLARFLFESGQASSTSAEEQVLTSWRQMRDELPAKYGTDKEMLISIFDKTRDDWIAQDTNEWVAANRLFPGVSDALNFSEKDVYVVTTKQKRFCRLLLESNGINSVPEDRIYGLGSGSKISVLKKIIKFPESKGKTVIFVEDRYETLEEVSLSMLGQPLQLFLATWGYNTEKSRKKAASHPFITPIDLDTFVTKFQ